MSWLVARSFGRHTVIFWTDMGTTVDDVSTPQDFFSVPSHTSPMLLPTQGAAIEAQVPCPAPTRLSQGTRS